MFFRPHDRNAPLDAPTRLITIKQEGGQATARVIRGPRHQNEDLGSASTGDEPFMATDHPAVTALLGLCQHHAGRIGTCTWMWLGHRKSRALLATDDRQQPALTLRRRCNFVE